MSLTDLKDEQTLELRIYRCETGCGIRFQPDEYLTVRRRVRVHRCRVAPLHGPYSVPVPDGWVNVPVVRFEGSVFRVRHNDRLGYHLMLPKG